MAGLLDNTKKSAKNKNPREMVIFSYPKVGKTQLMTKLPGNYLLLDFEGGADFYEHNGVSIPDLETFNALRKEFIEKQPQYDFIVLDTLTSLYAKLANFIAVTQYNKEEKKNKPLDYDITLLPFGVGYTYKRNAVQKIIDFFKKYCKCLILTGHVADKALGGNGDEASTKDLDLEGKLKNIISLKTDALALLYRSGINENSLSFQSSTGLIGGTRVQHLANKNIVISEMNEEGELIAHWDKVFIK